MKHRRRVSLISAVMSTISTGGRLRPWTRRGRAEVLAAARVVETLEAGGGGAEDDRRALHPRSHYRHVARVVARDIFLLEGVLVFLVHHNQAEPLDGSEDGRTRADHDVGLAPAYRLPLVVALARGQVAVENGHAREAPAETADGLGGE